jgi:hypothetical protein
MNTELEMRKEAFIAQYEVVSWTRGSEENQTLGEIEVFGLK